MTKFQVPCQGCVKKRQCGIGEKKRHSPAKERHDVGEEKKKQQTCRQGPNEMKFCKAGI